MNFIFANGMQQHGAENPFFWVFFFHTLRWGIKDSEQLTMAWYAPKMHGQIKTNVWSEPPEG